MILIFPYITRRSMLRLSVKNFRLSWDIISKVVSVGSSSMFRNGLAVVAGILLNDLAGNISDSVLAGVGVCTKIMMFPFSIILGFGSGFQPVAGFNWGAKRYDRVKEAFWFSTIVSMTFMALFSVVGFLLSGELIALFRDEAHVIEIGTKALRAQLYVFPLMGWVFLSNMMLQTIGRVFKASILAAARQGLAFIPVVLILPYFFGLEGLVWAQAVADVCAFLIALPIQISVLREMDKFEKGILFQT